MLTVDFQKPFSEKVRRATCQQRHLFTKGLIWVEKIEEAKLATKHYLEYLNRGFEENRDEKDQEYLTLLNTILEHRYILGFEYPELPKGTRREILRNTDSTLISLYEKIEALLPRSLSDSLFFKKDEVNWIWEIATEGK